MASLFRDYKARVRSGAVAPRRCTACLDELPSYKLSCCGDDFCVDCTKTMFDRALVCPKDACGAIQDPYAVKSATGVDWPWIFKRVKATFEIELNQAYCSKGSFCHFPCTSPDCGGIIAYNQETKLAVLPCNRCDTAFCRYCISPASEHDGAGTCPMQRGFDVMRELGMKRCPNPKCRAGIEKTEGCNSMQCLICHHYFCWLCGLLMDKRTVKHADMRAHAHFYDPDEGPNEIPNYYQYSRPTCLGLLFSSQEDFTHRNPDVPPYTGFP
jgi:hypothetical protein